jgi:hypothetical protein
MQVYFVKCSTEKYYTKKCRKSIHLESAIFSEAFKEDMHQEAEGIF